MLVPGVLCDTYSYGLKAQPGGSVGRAVMTPGSKPISVPARPLSEDQRANPGSGRRILTHPGPHSYHAGYDDDGRQTGVEYQDGTRVTYVFDDVGRRTSMADATGTTTYTLNAGGHLAAVAQPGGKTVTYTLEAGGRR